MRSLLGLGLLPLLALSQVHDKPREEYYLKAQGHYITGYHAGAGLNDAVLFDDEGVASKGYLNDTRQMFDLGTDFPWGMVMNANPNYGGWKPVKIDAGDASSGFLIEDDKLEWTGSPSFGGWLVCDWWYGVPQLFWIDKSHNEPYPSSCSETDLTVEYI